MKDMRTILMYIYTLILLTIDIPAQMRAFIDHQASFTSLSGKVGERGTEQASPDDQIIIWSHLFFD